ncbi:MAG: CCA tRNA nucleotidyltransferase [Candidatus Aenigmarchaeota archaeon]|nr:CCA tRNA nucleotidyltransferase [Candidatus Aenigmarchaeota archaeon]
MEEVLHKVLNKALKMSIPDEEERKITDNLCQKILESFQKVAAGFDIRAMFCGSVAKGTWLAKNKDIDMFLLFNERTPRKELEKTGMMIAKKTITNLWGKYEIAYSEHPYVRGFLADHRVEIVPAYDVASAEKIKSAVDRTPYHVRYVENRITENQANEVRLLKKFCRGIGVYGSDLKTEGFSGYLCELLIIEYENFENLLKEVSNWNPGEIIDMEHQQTKEKIMKKFHGDPLVVIDPVDRNRNVASVLSAEKFLLFVKKCREFLENPDIEFFEEKKRSVPELAEIRDEMGHRDTKFFMIKFRAPVTQEDVMWPQLRKFRRRITDLLEDGDFKVMRSDVWSDGIKCIVVIELLNEELPNIQVREGPSIFDKQGTLGFLRRYEGYNVFVENNKWFVEYSRRHRKALGLLEEFLNNEEGTLRESGVPKNLAREIKEKVEIFRDAGIYRLFRRYENFRVFMKEYLHKNLV